MRTRGFTGLFVLLPIAAACVFGYIGYGQYRRVETAKLERTEINADLRNVQQLLAALENQPLINKRVSAVRTEEEQANFLDNLRIHAANADVRVELFVAQAPAIRPEGQAPPPGEADTTRYLPMLSTVTVVGSFENTRAFAFAIMQSDRLMNMSQVKWDRITASGDLRLNFLLTRYVTEFDVSAEAGQIEADALDQTSDSHDETNGDSNEAE